MKFLFGSKRPIILNGIDDIATRADLADRSIVQTLAAISDERRKLETELWVDFERKHPRILGALLDVVSHGLKTLADVVLDRKPRMADFAVWVTACEGALWEKGTFMAAYTGNTQEAVETVLEAEQVATILRAYMDTTPQFAGTATELLKALNDVASETQQKAKGWPKSPAVLAKILRRIAPPLRKVGIDVSFPERENRQRRIIIAPVKVGETPSQPSPPSFSNSLNDLEKVDCSHRAVTDKEATVTSDGSDSDADSEDGGTVTTNRLKNKDGDGSDGSDRIFPNLTDEAGLSRRHPSNDEEPGLSRRRIQELADWYGDQSHQRYNEGTLNTAALDAELRAILQEEVPFPEHVEIEFEHVMKAVFSEIA
jgi:hypothetical protein